MPPKAGSRRGAAAAGGTAPRRNEGTEPTPDSNPNPNNAASASTPTGTTPRPPVQRLQSLKKRTPSGSIGPGGAATRSTSTGDAAGEPAKPTLKYQPRAVGRRSKEERENIEKVEAARNKERLKEAAAIQRAKASVAARGRAGFMGRGGARGGGMMGAAGPLGSGVALGGGRRGRGGGRFGGDSRASSMSRRSRSIMDVGGGDGGGAGAGAGAGGWSSDEDDSEIRISIDQINLESDADEDEDEVVVDQKKRWKGKGAMRAGRAERGLRPIRVERHEHEERMVSVNMESSSSKSAELREKAKAKAKAKEDDGALFVQDDDEGSATATETETKVKKEPQDDGDQTMVDVPHADEPVTTDDGLLPVQKVKVRRKLGSREQSVVVEIEKEEQEKDPKSLLRTKEDIEEYDRHVKDLEEIKKLLSKEPTTPTEKGTEPPAEGPDVATTTEDREKRGEGEDEAEALDKDKLSGQLFLVQFPPITPNLVMPGEEVQNADEDPTTTGNAGQNGTTDPAPKREDGVEVIEATEESAPTTKLSKVVTAGDWQLRPGKVGKLNVHASGRVTMDWGGISFELDRATEVNFLQEALIVSTPPNVPETEIVDDEQRVWAMGQLSGKFTVTPDWEKML